MYKIDITFVPVTEPEGPIQALGLNSRADYWEFDLAVFVTDHFEYEHKVTLVNQGTVLQVLTKGADGRITQMLPDYAFDLTQQPLLLTIIDTRGDGSNYKLRIQAGTLQNPTSTVVLSSAQNPQLRLAEFSYQQGNDIKIELGYIGAEDIRMGLTARVVTRPNETVQVSCNNGAVTIAY